LFQVLPVSIGKGNDVRTPLKAVKNNREGSGRMRKKQSTSSVRICVFLPRLLLLLQRQCKRVQRKVHLSFAERSLSYAKLISGISYSITFHSSGSCGAMTRTKETDWCSCHCTNEVNKVIKAKECIWKQTTTSVFLL